METLLIDGVRYTFYEYKDEDELEKLVVKHCKEIFGENALYFDKQMLETGAGIKARTDGFVISLDLNKWYILEIELSSHPLYEHIVSQITKFSTAYKSSDTRVKISRAFDDDIKNNPKKKLMFELKGIEKERYRFLSDLVESKPVIVIPIDHITEETKEVCGSLPFENKIIEFKTFVREGTENAESPVYAHLFESLYEVKPPEPPKEPKRREEIKGKYSEDEHLARASNETRELYAKLKQLLLRIGPGIKIKPLKHYIAFKSKTNFVDILILKKALKIWINMRKGELNDPKGLCRNVLETGHLGNGDYELKIQDDKNIEYIVSLAEQSYRKNSK